MLRAAGEGVITGQEKIKPCTWAGGLAKRQFCLSLGQQMLSQLAVIDEHTVGKPSSNYVSAKKPCGNGST